LFEEIKKIELLYPSKAVFSASNLQNNPNTEYPFPMPTMEVATGLYNVKIERPDTYFGEVNSLSHYGTARELLLLLKRKYRKISRWQVTTPPTI
jgi:hypothetical protein